MQGHTIMLIHKGLIRICIHNFFFPPSFKYSQVSIRPSHHLV
uniref:Uncharacterized protein n=1 Tax=Anguilla anguilla TaxID=7936 RepID=A0A0E9S810_ANGAN